MEQQIIFYSRQMAYRSPVGAVAQGQSVTLHLQLARRLGILQASIVVLDDAQGSRMEYPLEWEGLEGAYDCYKGEIPALPVGLYWYFFQLDGVDGRCYGGRQGREAILTDKPAAWQLSIYQKTYQTPDWIKGGLYYHIFVDRFCKEGDMPVREDACMHEDWYEQPEYLPDAEGVIRNRDFFGGTLRGITSKLRYLNSLGVTCLYLSPIFEAYSNHKYDTGNYMRIDPMFGTEQDFQILCQKAKTYGIRVVLDGVFNHTGSDSIYFNREGRYPHLGAYQSTESPYYKWYRFSEYPDRYESWWGIDTMPQVEENNPEYQEFICGRQGVVRKWLRAGASGWRLDVADELPDSFIEKVRIAAQAEKKDCLLIGEVWEDASNKVAYGKRRHYFEGKQLDSVMNYPLRSAILDFLLHKNAEGLAETMETICENYPPQVVHCLMNGLGTHDTPRLLTVLSGRELPKTRQQQAEFALDEQTRAMAEARVRQAIVLQMFLPGVPCVYYGDEAGLQGCGDPFNRGCYPWKQENRRLLAWYRKLGKLRKTLPVLKQGEYCTVLAENGCYIFKRSDQNGTLLVGVNLSENEISMPLERYYENCLSGHPSGDFRLPPGGSAVYYSAKPQEPNTGYFCNNIK